MKKVWLLILFGLICQMGLVSELQADQKYEQDLIRRIQEPLPADSFPLPVCGTPLMVEIRANWNNLTAETRKVLKAFISRPSYNFPERTYDTPSEHFKIHYVLEGDSGVYQPHVDVDPQDGHPDYINRCGEIFDHVWDYEVNILGYNPPPNDDWYAPNNGGDGKYDVYVLLVRGDPRYYGLTAPESLVSNGKYTSYIEMQNDYSVWPFNLYYSNPLDPLSVTAAHEFFHAIQVGAYDAFEYEISPQDIALPYWMEMTAVWMEDMVYDDVNDYLLYLPYFYNYPWISLKAFSISPTDPRSLHAYGSCVWPIYLSEKFGPDIITDIWIKCGEVIGPNALNDPSGEKSATDQILNQRGTTLEDEFREFTVWNYFTGERTIPGEFFSEANLFGSRTPDWSGLVWVDTAHQYHTQYPVEVSSIYFPPENLSANYVVFVPHIDSMGGLKINFTGETGEWKVSAIGFSSIYQPPLIQEFIIQSQTQEGTAWVHDWNQYTEVVMIPACVTKTSGVFTYQYTAEYDSSLHDGFTPPEKDVIGQNFPNPFVIEDGNGRTFFPFALVSPSRIEIDIFTLSGELIRKIRTSSKYPVGNYLSSEYVRLLPFWDGKNENGEYVASGIYLYQMRTKNTSALKKIAVIRK